MKYYSLSPTEITEAIKALTEYIKVNYNIPNDIIDAQKKVNELIKMIDTEPLNKQ